MGFLIPKPKTPAAAPQSKLANIHITTAILGKVIPILMGTRRLSQSLIYYSDFTAVPHVHQTAAGAGGKGLGGGGGSSQTNTTYTYQAATIGALCSGPVNGLMNVWDSKGRFQQTSVSENFTIPGGGGSHLVANHALYKVDRGVGFAQAFSQTVDDFGSPGSTTLSGSYQVPMTSVSQATRIQGSGGTNVLKYLIDVGLSQNGVAYTISISVYNNGTQPIYIGSNFTGFRQIVQPGTEQDVSFSITGNGTKDLQIRFETNVVGDSLDVFAINPVIAKVSDGINLIASGNLNFTGWQSLSGFGPPTLTQNRPLTPGAYVSDGAGTYTFHPVDAGKVVTINYSYNLLQLNNVETASIPGTPYQITVDDAADFLQDSGVVFYPSGTALAKVSSGPTAGQYSVTSGGLYTFAAADTAKQVQISYITNTQNQQSDAATSLSLTLFNGTRGQAAWSYLTSRHPEAAIGYTETAILASSALDLGSNAEVPNYSFEIAGPYQYGAGIVDCNPADVINALLQDPFFGIGFSSGNIGDWTQASNFWVANSFFVSPLLESQNSVASVIGQILEAGQTACFWSEGLFKLAPYGDTSAAGNGKIYVPATTPDVDFTDDQFIGTGVVKSTRSPWQDAYNKVTVTWKNRLNGYNDEPTTEQDDAAIQRYGLRQESPQSYDFICTETAAKFSANLRVKRSVNIRAEYTFSVPSRYSMLEPMDLVTLTVPELGWTKKPVRIKKIVDHAGEGGIEITAEEFPWGTAQPTLYNRQTGVGFTPNAGQADPGNTQALIFEAPDRLGKQAGNIIYVFVSGQSPDWGGCYVYSSFDGTNYDVMNNGQPVTAPARLGTLQNSLGVGSVDPDTSSFQVKMSSAGAVLPNMSTSDFNQFVSLCVLVDTMDNNPFELLAYKNATLVDKDTFQIDTLHRGLFGTPNASHASPEAFARLDQASFIFQYDPSYYGKSVSFKFPAFNTVGGRPQPLSQAAAYSFAISGVGPGALDLNTGLYRPGLGNTQNGSGFPTSFAITKMPTEIDISWSGAPLTRGSMPKPNQSDNTIDQANLTGSVNVTGLSNSTQYWFFPYVDDKNPSAGIQFVNNSQVSGAVGTPAIAYTSANLNAAAFQQRNDHVPCAVPPINVSTLAAGGGSSSGSGGGTQGVCPRGDMVVRRKTRRGHEIVHIRDLRVGDWIRGRSRGKDGKGRMKDCWVLVSRLAFKRRRDWVELAFDCGEDVVVTPRHSWPTDRGIVESCDLTAEHVFYLQRGRSFLNGWRRLREEDLCVSIEVDTPEHQYYLGRKRPVVLSQNFIQAS